MPGSEPKAVRAACPVVAVFAIAALREVIPAVGPMAAAVTAAIAALISGCPHRVWMIVFFIACRLFLDFALQPPLSGAQVAGIAGLARPVPALAAVQLICVRTRRPT